MSPSDRYVTLHLFSPTFQTMYPPIKQFPLTTPLGRSKGRVMLLEATENLFLSFDHCIFSTRRKSRSATGPMPLQRMQQRLTYADGCLSSLYSLRSLSSLKMYSSSQMNCRISSGVPSTSSTTPFEATRVQTFILYILHNLSALTSPLGTQASSFSYFYIIAVFLLAIATNS